MKPLFSSLPFKSGLMAVGLVVGLSVPVSAGPMMQLSPAVPASAVAQDLVQARSSWAGGNSRGSWRGEWRHNRSWRGHRGDRSWRGNNFRRHHFRRNDWHRHGGRRYRGGYYGGAGLLLGLGLGAPLYGYYDGYYDPYYAPGYYQPRRVYRGGDAHVRWCYARYRSYRASDNTFQPYHGPRRQCRSPY